MGGARVSDFFFTKNPNVKKKFFFLVCVCWVGGVAGGRGPRVSEFLFIGARGGGWGKGLE